ncbi:MAG: hypothetical protein VW239_00765 [Candidatus Nanopelagicales bacterium]
MLGHNPLSTTPLSSLGGGAIVTALDRAEETDSALALATPLDRATETDAPLGDLTVLKTLAIEISEETDAPLGDFTSLKTLAIERSEETDAPLGDLTVLKTLAIERSEETDYAGILAVPLSARATETDAPLGDITVLKTLALDRAEETDAPLGDFSSLKTLAIDRSEETDYAGIWAVPLSARATETSTSRDIVVERNHATVTGVGTCTFNWLYSTICRNPDTASGGVTPLNTSLHPAPAFFRHDRSPLEELESEAIDRKVQIVYTGTDEWLPLLPGTSGLMRDYGVTIRVGYYVGDHDWRSQAIIADDEHSITLALADRANWPSCINALTPRNSSLTPLEDGTRAILEMRWIVQTTGSDTYPNTRGVAQGDRSSGAGPATAAIETLYDIVARDPDTAADRLFPGSTALHAPGFSRHDRSPIDELESEALDRRVQVVYEGTSRWEWPSYGQRRAMLLTLRVGYFVGDHEMRSYPVMVDDEQQIVQAIMDPSNWTGCVHGFYPVASNVVVLDEARQILEIRFEAQTTTT